MSNTSGYTQTRFGGTQREPPRFSSGLKAPNANRPSTAAPAESTGGAKQDLNSSSDRINQYQNKLSTMREKFQQRKSALDGKTSEQPTEQKTSTIGSLSKMQS